MEKSNENFNTGKIAILVTTNSKKDGINLRKLRALLPDEEEHTCLSVDKIKNANTYKPALGTVSFHKKKGMVQNLIIRNKAPVIITTNHSKGRYKEDGISNGSRGYIDYIQTDKDGKVTIIWVVFRDEKIGSKCYKRETRKYRPKEGNYIDPKALPILPTYGEIEVKDRIGHTYTRYQFALSLAYAMTVHKCQGQTMDEVIIDFDRDENSKAFITYGSFYVAITRVTNGSKLWLRNFDIAFIKTDPLISYNINTMRDHYPYIMKKRYLREDIFTEESVKVGYLNINGLLTGYHAEYVNGDYNLQNLDLLALAETHLTKDIATETIQNIMTNWEILDRLDARDGKHHMGILLLGSCRSKKIKTHKKVDYLEMPTAQSLSAKIEGHKFSFIYCSRTPNMEEAKTIAKATGFADFLMGDLNLNPENLDDKKKLDTLCGKKKELLLHEITTKQKVQLDHIIGTKKNKYKVEVTSYKNFTSDHHSIVTRVSANGADFI
ncbi:MAG TPA: hypothetical protein EYQ26_15580 [Rhodospirillales bacterium]|nr:hypothetical protein [Rhodospirillales bacterium]